MATLPYSSYSDTDMDVRSGRIRELLELIGLEAEIFQFTPSDKQIPTSFKPRPCFIFDIKFPDEVLSIFPFSLFCRFLITVERHRQDLVAKNVLWLV